MKRHVLRGTLILTLLACSACLCACLGLGSLLGPRDTAVRFYLDGELYKTVEPTEVGSVEVPSVSIPEGYTLDGWYASETGTTLYDGTTREAYAYLKRTVYTITYELDGGTSDNPLTYTVETDTFTLRPPIKEGYTFVGWRSDRIDGIVQEVSVPRGTIGELSFAATYEPTRFPITYDLDGGEADNPTEYTVLTEDFTLIPPTRAGYRFYAWECDGVLYPVYTVAQGSTGALNLRAVWSTGLAMFSYTPSVMGVSLISDTAAGEVKGGTEVTVCAPAMHGDCLFVGWLLDETLVSYAASYTFTVGTEDVHLVAQYEDASPYVYDKKDGTSLTLSTHAPCTPTAVYGGGVGILSDASYGRGYATLSSTYLEELPVGTYTYFVDDAMGGAWFLVRVIDSRRPTELAIVYDTAAFPDAVVTFACTCDGAHSYSLDGGAHIPCDSGDILPDYRKGADHTLTVFCAAGGQATVTRAGYSASSRAYYETTFTFCGATYDYAIESEEEYSVLFDYLITVRGVTDYTRDVTADLTYGFYLCEELLYQLEDEDSYNALYARVFSSKSYPMSPTVSTAYSVTDPARCSLTLTYPHGLNDVRSTQRTTVIPDTSNLETTSGRPSNFDSFPIDAYPTVPVRTLYELELLPCGVRPIFSDTESIAARVYERARAILRTIVDDTMNGYQKTAAIYRYLATHVTYDEVAYVAADASKYRSFTSYGALVDGLAVCDGYASAFRLMCQIEGIVCEEYTGRNDPNDPTSGHAWNKYTIDGVTYACDVTWARVSDEYITMYYLMMDEAMLLDTGHYENASATDRFTAVTADGMFDYYERFETAPLYDLHVTSYDEFLAAIEYGMKQGLSCIELCMPWNVTEMYIRTASMELRTSLGAVSVGDEAVYILFE